MIRNFKNMILGPTVITEYPADKMDPTPAPICPVLKTLKRKTTWSQIYPGRSEEKKIFL